MTEVADRLDRAERELGRLGHELAAIRELAEQNALQQTVAKSVSTPPPAPSGEGVAAVQETLQQTVAKPSSTPPSSPAPTPPAQAAPVGWTPPPWTPKPPRPPKPPKPPRAPRREIDVAELFGPRALAWAGGLVTILGVVFVFALAANRGWIGPVERVGLGAIASLAVFALGLLAHRRHGNLYAAVAAAGAGIAGGYVTLLVAAARYDLLEAVPALAVALAIAALGTATALRWQSEPVAAFGLVGAILVPLVTLLDGGVTPLGTGFALLVLAGACVVGVRMEWRGLLAAAAGCGLLEIGLLVVDEGEGAPARVVALSAAFAAVLLAAGLARGLALDRLGRSLVLASAALTGLSIPLLLNGRWLGLDAQGTAFVVAALVYLAVAAGLFVHKDGRDTAALVGALGLSLGAVGAAYLLDGPGLVVAWSAQAVLLAWLAGRVGDARIGFGALAHLTLAVGHAIVVDAPIEQLVEPVSEPAQGVVAILAAAAGAGGLALLVGRWPAVETLQQSVAKSDLGGWIAGTLDTIVRPRAEIRVAAGSLAAAGAMYAAALGILELAGDFGSGQIAVIATWSGIALAALVAGIVLRQSVLRIGGLAVLGATLVDLAGVQSELTSIERGIAGLAAAGALLAAAVLHERVRAAGPVALAVPVAGAIAFWASVQLWQDEELGLGLVAVAVPFAVLAALRFRLRDLSTLLWATGLALALVAPALISDGTWAVLAWTLAASALATLGAEVGERRLLAAACAPLGLALASTLVMLAPVGDLLAAGNSPGSGVWAVALCTGALAALVVSLGRLRGEAADAFDRAIDDSVETRRWLAAAAGGLGLYGLSLAVLALVAWIGTADVDTEFQRGHTAVSALWGLVALGLVLAGLRRSLRSARIAGLVLLALTLVKIFLFDLARLDSVTRALSFLAVGAVLLLAGFFTQQLTGRREGEPEANGA